MLTKSPREMGMSVEQETVTRGPRWLIHDSIIGLFAGGGVGSLVGVFMSVRWFDSNLLTLVGAVAGAVVGVTALLGSHRRSKRFLTSSVVLSWVLLLASGAFIAGLANAIAKFN